MTTRGNVLSHSKQSAKPTSAKPRTFVSPLRRIVCGKSYDIAIDKDGRNARRVHVLRFDTIDNCYVARAENGQEQRFDFNRYKYIVRGCGAKPPTKMSTDAVFLYIADLGNGYTKFGCSADPHSRIKQMRTFCPTAKIVHTIRLAAHKRATWSKHERQVLNRFKRKSGAGSEVLKLSAEGVGNLLQYAREVAK